MTVAMALQSISLAEPASKDVLDEPHSLACYNASTSKVIGTELFWKPLQFNLDPDVQSALEKDQAVCTMFFYGADFKYVLAWVIHAADANATFRDDGSIYIAPKEKLKVCDPVFACFRDTEGPWVDELSKQLHEDAIEETLTEDTFIKYLNSFHNRYLGLSFVVDPTLPVDEVYNAKVGAHVGAEGTCGDELASVLKQVGLTYKLQGGAVLISK